MRTNIMIMKMERLMMITLDVLSGATSLVSLIIMISLIMATGVGIGIVQLIAVLAYQVYYCLLQGFCKGMVINTEVCLLCYVLLLFWQYQCFVYYYSFHSDLCRKQIGCNNRLCRGQVHQINDANASVPLLRCKKNTLPNGKVLLP